MVKAPEDFFLLPKDSNIDIIRLVPLPTGSLLDEVFLNFDFVAVLT